jgi:hypothetical protein
MESAIFGLVGVLLGGGLTIFKDWWIAIRKEKKEAEYLSIRVSCALEAFLARCAEVVGDDGLSEGRTDDRGYHKVQVEAPKFEPELLPVEWKSLPTSLMYEVLNFPNLIDAARGRVSYVSEWEADPPEYHEFFEERQLQYGKLGLEAYRLADALRRHTGLPGYKVQAEWDPRRFMEEHIAKIEALRADRLKKSRDRASELVSL